MLLLTWIIFFPPVSLFRLLSLISGIQKTLPVDLVITLVLLLPPVSQTHTNTFSSSPVSSTHPQSSCYKVNCADSAHWSSSDYCGGKAFWTLLFTYLCLLKWRIFQNVGSWDGWQCPASEASEASWWHSTKSSIKMQCYFINMVKKYV